MEFYGINACFLEQYITFKKNMGYALKDIYTTMFPLVIIWNFFWLK